VDEKTRLMSAWRATAAALPPESDLALYVAQAYYGGYGYPAYGYGSSLSVGFGWYGGGGRGHYYRH